MGQIVFGAVTPSLIGVGGNPNDINLVSAPPIYSNPENASRLLGYLAS